ncbi:hypothetical protein ACJ72_05646 [Emergomyces africanus]|uniref:Uncharacterized protein n=1 Tax=Emergomyces africanus TaxID=1955775 RepID=A0A1B7NTU4_9EURO|nr:hypothetical protein ACJ72_05646 [Emergomyces africanus]
MSHRHVGASVSAYLTQDTSLNKTNEAPSKGVTWLEKPGRHHKIRAKVSATDIATLLATFVIEPDRIEKEGPAALVYVNEDYSYFGDLETMCLGFTMVRQPAKSGTRSEAPLFPPSLIALNPTTHHKQQRQGKRPTLTDVYCGDLLRLTFIANVIRHDSDNISCDGSSLIADTLNPRTAR